MKKVVVSRILVRLIDVSANAMTYECWSYKCGQLDKSFDKETK